MKNTPMLPVVVNRKRGKVVIEVRRESDTEIMQSSILKYGKVRIRVIVQIRGTHGNWMGWHGASSRREAPTIKEAREFKEALRKFVEGG
jgi:hypothetical protein